MAYSWSFGWYFCSPLQTSLNLLASQAFLPLIISLIPVKDELLNGISRSYTNGARFELVLISSITLRHQTEGFSVVYLCSDMAQNKNGCHFATWAAFIRLRRDTPHSSSSEINQTRALHLNKLSVLWCLHLLLTCCSYQHITLKISVSTRPNQALLLQANLQGCVLLKGRVTFRWIHMQLVHCLTGILTSESRYLCMFQYLFSFFEVWPESSSVKDTVFYQKTVWLHQFSGTEPGGSQRLERDLGGKHKKWDKCKIILSLVHYI